MFLVLTGISSHLSDSPEISERLCRSATAGKRSVASPPVQVWHEGCLRRATEWLPPAAEWQSRSKIPGEADNCTRNSSQVPGESNFEIWIGTRASLFPVFLRSRENGKSGRLSRDPGNSREKRQNHYFKLYLIIFAFRVPQTWIYQIQVI